MIRYLKQNYFNGNSIGYFSALSNNVSDVLNAAAQTLIKLRSFTERRRF
jgi:hypothetical protein